MSDSSDVVTKQDSVTSSTPVQVRWRRGCIVGLWGTLISPFILFAAILGILGGMGSDHPGWNGEPLLSVGLLGPTLLIVCSIGATFANCLDHRFKSRDRLVMVCTAIVAEAGILGLVAHNMMLPDHNVPWSVIILIMSQGIVALVAEALRCAILDPTMGGPGLT